MKTTNIIKRAPKVPQPGTTYGARVGGIRLRAKGVTIEWVIYSHKRRAKKGKAK